MESSKGFFRGSHVSNVRYMERLFHKGKIQTPKGDIEFPLQENLGGYYNASIFLGGVYCCRFSILPRNQTTVRYAPCIEYLPTLGLDIF